MATLDKDLAPHDGSNTCRRWVLGYTGPSSYATGGDSMTPEDVGMGKIFAVLGLTITNGTLTYIGWYNRSTEKIMWFDMAGAQVANGVDLDAFTGSFEVIGQ